VADTSRFILFKHGAQKVMEEAKKVVARVDSGFKPHFNRGYGLFEKIRCIDAEGVLLSMCTAASTAREVIEEYRKQGKNVGLYPLRRFRPFPGSELIRILGAVRRGAVLDRDKSLRAGGIVAQELKTALFQTPRKARVFEFIAGLVGKDITPETIQEVMEIT